MTLDTYPEPVSQLLTAGDCYELGQLNYEEQFGLTAAHIPELIRLATDTSFNTLPADRPEIWAPVHAWRSLGQLKAEVAIAPLITLFDQEEDDFIREDLPEVFGQIGAVAIPALAAYLADESQDEWARTLAIDCLLEIMKTDPDSRAVVIAPLMQQLEHFATNGGWVNSVLIDALTHHKVVEAAPLIKQAFDTGEIDEFLTGTWANIQVDLGLKRKDDFTKAELTPTPPPNMAEVFETVQKISQMLTVQTQQTTKPAGFGAPPKPPEKKKQKKKKK